MRAGIVILLAVAMVWIFPATFAEDGDRESYLARLRLLQKELAELGKNPDPKKLEDLNRRWAELRKEDYDFTKGKSEVCPVHQIKMAALEVPIEYGLFAMRMPPYDDETRLRTFPFAQSKISGGCVVGSVSPKSGKLFVCPKCVEAEKAWLESHKEGDGRQGEKVTR